MVMADSELFVDMVLWAVYLLLAGTVGVAVWSSVHGVRTHARNVDPLATRHTSMIGYATAGFVAVTLLLTCLFASTQPVQSNGQPFTDALWLRLSDMFIYTSILLICACSAIVVAAKFRR